MEIRAGSTTETAAVCVVVPTDAIGTLFQKAGRQVTEREGGRREGDREGG